jgi:LPXTG-motif cell wall-anchored protein
VLAATITVTSPTGAAAAPGGGSNRAAPVGALPKTGSNAVLPLLAVAVALVVLGTVAVLVVRRKDAPGPSDQGLA